MTRKGSGGGGQWRGLILDRTGLDRRDRTGWVDGTGLDGWDGNGKGNMWPAGRSVHRVWSFYQKRDFSCFALSLVEGNHSGLDSSLDHGRGIFMGGKGASVG